MTPLPPPAIPWQLTGNHWLALPCIHPADGALYAVGLLHRGARSAIEFAGGSGFLEGDGPPLLAPSLILDGQATPLGSEGIVWERALGWLPTLTASVGTLMVRATIFAPIGRDADMAGAVYAISVENRGSAEMTLGIAIDGTLGHRQQRVRSARPFDDAHRVIAADGGVVVLEGSSRPGLVAIAVGADGDPVIETHGGPVPSFTMRRTVTVAAGAREQVAFYIAAGPERDGAEATVAVMRRRGWRDLLAATRDALQSLEQSTGNEPVDRLINRNLLFAYFFAVGRALDDAHFYLMRTRVPWHSRGVTVRDWEALAWTIPAVQLADPPLARELLLRMCEIHGYAPGRGVHYFDGTLFEPGFSLEGVAGYAVAVDRYIRETGDDEIVEEPVLADTLYLSSEDLASRRDRNVPLYSTEVSLSGTLAPLPFTLHGNAVAAQALDVLRRTLDEASARDVEDPEAVRAALRRHFTVESDGKKRFATAIDLSGQSATADDPHGSVLWLPLYDAVTRDDSAYRRSVKAIGSMGHGEGHLAHKCAQLLGPDGASVLQWLRRVPLDNTFAAEMVDEEGRASGNGGDASLSGLLAWSTWYAAHALGILETG